MSGCARALHRRDISRGKVGFVELEKYALNHPDPADQLPSGKQELYEIWLGRYVR